MSDASHRRHYCSHCGQPANRMHRRWYDRLLSLIVPVRRYRCPFCGWTGLVRQTKRRAEVTTLQGTAGH